MYPITYEADYNPAPNRWTTFFRPILAIPWLIVAVFWGILFLFTHTFAWVAVVVLGRYPEWLYDFNSGVLRFGIRANGWIYLQSDEWPPFGLGPDPAYPIRIGVGPRPERQSRLKALFRLILALPIAFVASCGNRFVLIGLAIIAWLTIVFRGYMPRAVHDGISFVNGLDARVFGYIAILTDEYPPIGLDRPGGSAAVAAMPPPAAPEAA